MHGPQDQSKRYQFAILVVAITVTGNCRADSGPFVHVYDMPSKFTTDVLAMPLDEQQHPWTRWYNTDQASVASMLSFKPAHSGHRRSRCFDLQRCLQLTGI